MKMRFEQNFFSFDFTYLKTNTKAQVRMSCACLSVFVSHHFEDPTEQEIMTDIAWT